MHCPTVFFWKRTESSERLPLISAGTCISEGQTGAAAWSSLPRGVAAWRRTTRWPCDAPAGRRGGGPDAAAAGEWRRTGRRRAVGRSRSCAPLRVQLLPLQRNSQIERTKSQQCNGKRGERRRSSRLATRAVRTSGNCRSAWHRMLMLPSQSALRALASTTLILSLSLSPSPCSKCTYTIISM